MQATSRIICPTRKGKASQIMTCFLARDRAADSLFLIFLFSLRSIVSSNVSEGSLPRFGVVSDSVPSEGNDDNKPIFCEKVCSSIESMASKLIMGLGEASA
ncbi:hypothetical protein SDJN02_07513, partial [Cucurbita argyrosperma subsp. argyrosperma]